MVGKQDKTPQLSIFDTPLERFINLEHELCILSGQIDWESIEKEFSVYFSEIGLAISSYSKNGRFTLAKTHL